VKYLLMIYSNPTSWGHPIYLRTQEALSMSPADRDEMERQGEAVIAEITATGELVGSGALADPITSRTVQIREGARLVTDGPFVEAKEQLAGYFLLDVETAERAEEVAARFPDARFAAVELRPLIGAGGEEL
jgi:hypothetical protein